MDAYEIRILRKESSAAVILACSQASDHAAIRRAKSLVGDGDCVEVWRGLDCVYVAGTGSTDAGLRANVLNDGMPR